MTGEIEWLDANREEDATIAQANARLNTDGTFVDELVLCRHEGDVPLVAPDRIDYMDVAPEQLVSIAAALIPFLEHDDANRALMGSNMQRQSVPLLNPRTPLVGTGLEEKVARDSGAVIIAKRGGVVTRVTADEIVVDAGPVERSKANADRPLARLTQHDRYRIKKYWRTNQDTAVNQRPLVKLGQKVKAGEVIGDGAGTELGQLALGANVTVAFMPWYGHNFEDAIVLSERLVSDDVYSSIHIQELELHVRDTKRGQEEITREIPNVAEESLLDLDERGIVRIGAHVKAGDILVGKITPKGETELSPEEKLLTAIFGEKAKDVKDSSLKVSPGMEGVVIDVKIFSRIDDQVIEKDRGERIGEVRRIEGEEKIRVNEVRDSELVELLDGQTVALALKNGTVEEAVPAGTRLTAELLAAPQAQFTRPQDVPRREQEAEREDPRGDRGRESGEGAARGEGGGTDRQDPAARRTPARRDPAREGLSRREAQDLGGRQDGRPSRQQGHRGPHRAGRGHALPAGWPAGGHRAQPARRAEPHERGADPRDPPRVGRADARLLREDARVPGRERA